MVSTPQDVSNQCNGIGEGRLVFRIPGGRADRRRLISDQVGRCQRDDRVETAQCGRPAVDAPVVLLTWRFESEMSPRFFTGGFNLPPLDEPCQDLHGVEFQLR
jgi:hypothetical protein